MRRKTKYSSAPDAAEIIKTGTHAVVRLRENIEEVEGKYQADEYELIVPYAGNLATRVNAEFAVWLENAKAADYAAAAKAVREKRNRLLAETDKEMCIDRMGIESPSGTTWALWKPVVEAIAGGAGGSMAAYRQALRDVTAQDGFPYDILWPEKEG